MNQILGLCFLLTLSKAYPDGAPQAACSTLAPNHGVEAQGTESPYKFTYIKNELPTSITINVKVAGTSGEMFRGFIVQAQNSSGIGIGDFDLTGSSGAAKHVDCSNGGQKDTVTHTNYNDKSEVTFIWIAPAFYNPAHKVNFVGTVVKEKEVFWSGIESNASLMELNYVIILVTSFLCLIKNIL